MNSIMDYGAEPTSRSIKKNTSADKSKPGMLPEVCIERNALYRLYRNSTDKRIRYVQAPAGFSKTVSTHLWLLRDAIPYLWINLDEYDNSPAIFYRQLCMALADAIPSCDNSLFENLSRFLSSPIEHALLFLSELSTDEPLTIVFDDLHFISNEEILRSLPSAIQRIPSAFSITFLSRTEPPASLDVFGNDMALIEGNNLTFSPQETRDFLETKYGQASMEQARSAYELTGGWPIALSALASSSTLPDLENKPENILEQYLETQIWTQIPSFTQNELMTLSIVDEFDPELVELLLKTDGRRKIDELIKKNLFISKAGTNYRFHALFLQFLRHRLDESNIKTKRLQKNVAQYYRERGDEINARRFAIKSDQIKLLSKQIMDGMQYNTMGNNRSVASYVSSYNSAMLELSTDKLSRYPYLHISQTWYYFLAGDAMNMTKALDRLYEKFPTIALFHQEFYDISILISLLDPRKGILERIEQFNRMPDINVKHEQQQGSSISMNMPLAHRSLRDYYELSTVESYEPLRKTIGAVFKIYMDTAIMLIQSGYALERNQFTKASHIAVQTQDQLPDDPSDEVIFATLIHRLMPLYAAGKDDEAGQLEREIENTLHEKEALYLIPNFLSVKTDQLIRKGNKRAAEEWMDQYFVHDEDRLKLYKIHQYLTTIRALLALDRPNEALMLAERVHELAEAFARPLDRAEADMLACIALHRLNRTDQGLPILQSAILSLFPYHFTRIFSMEGSAILPVLKQLRDQVDEKETLSVPGDEYVSGRDFIRYLNEIIMGAQEQKGKQPGIPHSRDAIKLSRQQKKMIEYLAKGYKNQDIVEETGLSIKTVKTHLFHAYRKLEVGSATDAVAKARDIGIIE